MTRKTHAEPAADPVTPDTAVDPEAAAAEAAAKAAEEAAAAEAAAKAAEEAAAAEAAARAAAQTVGAEAAKKAALDGLRAAIAGIEAIVAIDPGEVQTEITLHGGVFADSGTGWHRLTLAGITAEASALSMLPAAWCATARQAILDAQAAAEEA